MSTKEASVDKRTELRHLARVILSAFLLTFMAARILVFLIMDERIPDLYLYVGGTHVHHLNYGIFLLSGVGGYLVFKRPRGRTLAVIAALYGIGLALTFDEFGMWLHLGGSYWQRASFDAISVVAAFLTFLAFIPSIWEWRSRHYVLVSFIIFCMLLFFALLIRSVTHVGQRLEKRFAYVEDSGDSP